MRQVFGLLLAISAPAAIWGQSAPKRAEFEVASIKASAPYVVGQQMNLGLHIDGALVSCATFSLKDYIRIAYKLKDYQVLGPEWIGSERFDINAKIPAGGTRDQVLEMLQTLLEDRFEIKSHHDSKEFPVYALTVMKGGPKMKESPIDPEADSGNGGKEAVNVTASGGRAGTTVNLGKGASFSLANDAFEGKKLTMTQMADTLARFVDRPVVDATDLKGSYDFKLTFTPEDFRAMMIHSAIAAGVNLPPEALRLLDGANGDSLFTALQTLGLKLESRKAPLDVLVIDHVLKTPTEN